MQCRVGDIRVKRGWSEIWIHTIMDKIMVMIHFTQKQEQTKANKQINKKKEKI